MDEKMDIINTLWEKYTSWRFWLDFLKGLGAFTFIFYVGISSIYYIHLNVYKDLGMQTGLIDSAILVVMVLIGSVTITKRVMKK